MCYNELIFSQKGGRDYEGRTTLSPGAYYTKGERALTAGHPWVYAAEVTELSGPVEDGGLADVIGHKGALSRHGLL